MPHTVVSHPLVQHKLSLLRDKETSTASFRQLVREIATLLCYEATRDLPLEEIAIKTPVSEMEGKVLRGQKLVFAPILRAGLGLLEGMLDLVPSARVAHIGLFRDEDTLEPHSYFFKAPSDLKTRRVIVIDPMLATAGSAMAAIDQLKEKGAIKIQFVCILAAPEGIKRFEERHPNVDIITAAIDDHLNEKGYIVPGLGDAGDRIFGTK